MSGWAPWGGTVSFELFRSKFLQNYVRNHHSYIRILSEFIIRFHRSEIHNFEETKIDSEITIGFVFHARKYSDGSSNLRIQFTRGRGQQYAKNSGLRIYRKHWISKKTEVSEKHLEYEKVNKL